MSQNRSSAVMAQRIEAHDSLEDWRNIPSFPGYRASSSGRIEGKKGGTLAQVLPKDGYPQVKLVRKGEVCTRDVHALVCEAFYGLRPSPGHEAAHGDGVRSNCSAANLRWATRSENREDMKRHGTWQHHDKHPRATTTFCAALEIRRRHARDATTSAGRVPRGWRGKVASEYGISISAVKDILAGRAWV